MNSMTKNWTLFIALFGLTLISCDPAKTYADEISQVDSCLVVIDDIQEKYNGIEFDSIVYMVEHVLQNEDSIKKYYKPDTISMEIGTRMNDCKGVHKSMKGVKSKETSYQNEVTEMRTQFENLKEDILNGVLKEEQINKYMTTEMTDLNNLNLSFSEFYELQKSAIRYFYSSSPIIDDFIVELKNETNQE